MPSTAFAKYSQLISLPIAHQNGLLVVMVLVFLPKLLPSLVLVVL
jgi:hypothetical protein